MHDMMGELDLTITSIEVGARESGEWKWCGL
jgi:hypothetical protein